MCVSAATDRITEYSLYCSIVGEMCVCVTVCKLRDGIFRCLRKECDLCIDGITEYTEKWSVEVIGLVSRIIV